MCDRVRLRRQDGNTLALFPAAVLVMFVLAAIAVDATVLFNARRQVADVATTVANDAATALAADDLYAGGTVTVDLSRAAGRARDAVTARWEGDGAPQSLQIRCDDLSVGPDGATVTVACEGSVRMVFARVGWLRIGTRTVTASATARAEQR